MVNNEKKEKSELINTIQQSATSLNIKIFYS